MNYVEIDEKLIQSFEYETTIQSENNGSILGVCELGKASIQLINEENNYSSYKGSWISTIHGSFYIYDVAPVQERVNIKLDCYDIKYKLDTPYNSSHHTFPCTLKEWRNSIFDDCDVEYDNSDFPNSNLLLDKEPYIGENPSNRTVISLIAQAGASTVITDSLDCFYFDWFSNTIYTVEDWSSLITEKEYSLPVNCVVLGRGNTEDNVFYPETKPTNPVEFRIDNNYILDPQDTSTDEDRRYTTRVPIYNRINGFKYLIFDIKSTDISNKLSIKLGQKIKYSDIWDNELEAYIMTKKIIWIGGDLENDDNYEIQLSAKEVKETSTDLSYANSVQNDILRVERKADKNAGKIEDLVSEVTENKESITKLELNVDNITSRVSTSETKIENIEKTTQTSEGGNHLYLEKALGQDALEYHIKGKSEQENTSGKNLLPDIFRFSNQTINGITLKNNNNGSFTITGVATQNFSIQKFLSNEEILSNNFKLPPDTYMQQVATRIQLYNLDGTWKVNTYRTFTTTEETLIGGMYLEFTVDKTYNDTYWYQLEEGSVATNYEPYTGGQPSPNPDYPSEIKTIAKDGTAKLKITGANLYNYKDLINLNSGVKADDDGWITIAGDNTNGANTFFRNYWTHNLFLRINTNYNIFLEVKSVSGSGKIFLVSTESVSQFAQTFSYDFNDLENNNIYYKIVKTKADFSNSNAGLRTYVRFSSGQSGSITFRISVLEDTTITPENFEYEEYKEREVLIDLNKYDEEGNIVGNYELSSLPDGTSNDLDIVDGQVVLNERVGKVVLDGMNIKLEGVSNLHDNNTYMTVNYFKKNIKQLDNNKLITVISDKLLGASNHDTWAGNILNSISQAGNGNYLQLCLPQTIGTTITKINSWLSENPVTVYYELAEPQQIILPSVQIPLFEGINHLSLVEDLETDTSIKYLRETPFSKDYALNVDLDKTNSNLSDTNHQLGQAQSDINATNTHLNNDFYDKTQIDSIQTSTEQNINQIKNTMEVLQTANDFAISKIQDIVTNGVSKVVTTNTKFDDNGWSIKKDGEEMSSVMDWDGFDVTRDRGKATEEKTLIVRSSGTMTSNLEVKGKIIQRPILKEIGTSISDGESVGLCEYWIGVEKN